MAHAPSLEELQRWMRDRISPSRIGQAEPSDAVLNPQRGVPGEERMAVYAGGYLIRVREALAEVYEAVHQMVGERQFAELARAYAARHPSRDYNLTLSGRHLPEFLLDWPLTQRLPFLPDLARLEWRICAAFHAFEQPPLDAKRLSQLSLDQWDRVRLGFQPSVALVSSAWPIRDLWEARTMPRERIDIDLVNRPQRVLVYRQEVRVVCDLVPEAQHAVLDGLLRGDTLWAVCQRLAGYSETEPLPLQDWFFTWFGRGLITRCELAGDSDR